MRARPTHHLIVAEAPKWALERIDKDVGHSSGQDQRGVVEGRAQFHGNGSAGLGVMDLSKHWSCSSATLGMAEKDG